MPDYVYQKMLDIAAPTEKPTDDYLKALDKLAKFMTDAPSNHNPTINPNSTIPAGYTYLSQFIDHDIALDSTGKTLPWNMQKPEIIYNQRAPFFDLETIYGSKDPVNEGETPRADLLETKARLKLSYTLREPISKYAGIRRAHQRDLPRDASTLMASIVDSRNDENFLVAQTQVAFVKFHNAIVSYLGEPDSNALFERARKMAIRHYQYIILYDFLPKIIKQSVIDDVVNYGNKIYLPQSGNMFMPFEFSAAAYRTGHSMIRSEYILNRAFNSKSKASLNTLVRLTGRGRMNGGIGLSSIWLIDWELFYDIDNSKINKLSEFNFASKISTKLSEPLGFLPDPDAPGRTQIEFNKKTSLAALDLYRGQMLELPTGESVAQVIAEKAGAAILTSAEIQSKMPPDLLVREAFKDKTPLWFYILAEAETQTGGETLGDVGGRIIAETFIGLLRESPFSILKTPLQSDQYFLAEDKKTFGMQEMLKFVASQNFGEPNPTIEGLSI